MDTIEQLNHALWQATSAWCSIDRRATTETYDNMPSAASVRTQLFEAKTMKEKTQKLFEWAQASGLFSNMEDAEKTLYLELRDKFLKQ